MLILFLVTLCATIFFTWYVKRIFLRARIADNPIVSEHRHKICNFFCNCRILSKYSNFISFIHHACRRNCGYG